MGMPGYRDRGVWRAWECLATGIARFGGHGNAWLQGSRGLAGMEMPFPQFRTSCKLVTRYSGQHDADLNDGRHDQDRGMASQVAV
jgi:hypothetical protein